MSFQVTLKTSGHQFTVTENETILDAALRQKIGLPYGCHNGACGACKGKVIAGEIHLGVHSNQALTEQDRVQGYALFCCSTAQSDLIIEASELSSIGELQVKTLPCRIEKINKINDVVILKLKLPVNERFRFLAGQYIDILLKDGKKRSFSMANPPHDDAYLELHIRHQAGGSFSEYVFFQMKEREILRFRGPLGSFFLREDLAAPIIFLASGTGFAPIKGMLEHAFYRKLSTPMSLYWGARTRADLYMHDLVQSWQQAYPDLFHYIPVLSDPLARDQWLGRTGLVHQAVLDDFADLSGYQVYACGAPIMVEAAHRTFIDTRALPEETFFSDAFFMSKDLPTLLP